MALRLASIFSSEASPAAEQAAPATERAWEIRRLRSGGRWPESLANYDPDSCCWRTSQISLLSSEGTLGERFSGTWARSGMSLLGTAYPLPPLVPRTSAIGSSPLLPTPMARTNSGTEVSGASRTDGPMLAEALLPTPVGQDGKNATAPSQANRNSLPLTHALLPTPNASLQNYEEDTDQFLARREKLKERHGNGNGIGLPLGVAMRMLPTPAKADGERQSEKYGGGNLTLRGSLLPTPHGMPKEGQKRRPGPSGNELGVALRRATLLPTPTTGDSKQARNKTSGRREGSQHHSGTTLTDFAYESNGATTQEPSPDGSKSPAPLLSPYFVEWMLGLPAGWSDPDCPLSATEFKSRQASSSAGESSTTRQAA